MRFAVRLLGTEVLAFEAGQGDEGAPGDVVSERVEFGFRKWDKYDEADEETP